MKAIRVHSFGGPDVLRLEDVPEPRPSAGQVRVRLRAAGVNPVETYIRAGQYGRLPTLPYTPGFDGAGVVEEVGEGVTRFAPGDRVYVASKRLPEGAATYAEATVVDQGEVWPLPDGVDFAQGAAVGIPCATAFRALHFVGRAQPGDWVLVHGASGGVGTAAVQLAKGAGLHVVATAGSEAGRELALSLGADVALPHEATEEARLETGGRGFDVILELAAHANLGRDLALLAPGGRVVVVGSRGPVEINPRELMNAGAAITALSHFYTPDEEYRRIHEALVAALRSGVLRPVVGRRLPLAQVARAHEAVLEPGAVGKVALEIA
ncbi:MAG: NADPH:quinone reductase [Clostridia bacterium]|nr:NADPH:quinone reductase [Clostridia bacterium]